MVTKTHIILKDGTELKFSLSCSTEKAADMFEKCESIQSAWFMKDPAPKLGLRTTWLDRDKHTSASGFFKEGRMRRGGFGFLECTAD